MDFSLTDFSQSVDMIARIALALLSGLTSVNAVDGDPPVLPTASASCVGPSPVRYSGTPRPVAQLTPQRAWPLTRGAGVVVSIVDSGVAVPPQLAGAVQPGRDIVAGGPATDDCLGRGTALAGIVAARPEAATGVVGVAPAAIIVPVRITDQRGSLPDHAIANGIRAAAELGAKVILVGLSVPEDSPELRSAVEQAISADIVVVAPVLDQKGAKASYPASYDQVLGVGGVGAAGVEVIAPAVDAISVGPAGGHYRVSGSAVAAAYVAGTVALIRSYYPKLTQAQVRQRLSLTKEPSGSLDLYAAVATIDPAAAKRTAPAPAAEQLAVPARPAPDPARRRAAVLAAAIVFAVAMGVSIVLAIRRARAVRPKVSE